MTDEREWVDHQVRTYSACMDPKQRAGLDYRVRGAIADDGARRERARRMVYQALQQDLAVNRIRATHVAA